MFKFNHVGNRKYSPLSMWKMKSSNLNGTEVMLIMNRSYGAEIAALPLQGAPIICQSLSVTLPLSLPPFYLCLTFFPCFPSFYPPLLYTLLNFLPLFSFSIKFSIHKLSCLSQDISETSVVYNKSNLVLA